jgi:hypothetical protein
MTSFGFSDSLLRRDDKENSSRPHPRFAILSQPFSPGDCNVLFDVCDFGPEIVGLMVEAVRNPGAALTTL